MADHQGGTLLMTTIHQNPLAELLEKYSTKLSERKDRDVIEKRDSKLLAGRPPGNREQP